MTELVDTEGNPIAVDVDGKLEIEPYPSIKRRFLDAVKSMDSPKKSGYNNHQKYDYSTLSDMYKVIKPALYEQGLYLSQPCEYDAESNCVVIHTYIECPETGENLTYSQKIPVGSKIDPKSIGAVETYGKKYAISGIFCLGGEEDLDRQDKNKGSFSGKQGYQRQNTTQGHRVAKPDPTYDQKNQQQRQYLANWLRQNGHIQDENQIAAISIGLDGKPFNEQNIRYAIQGLKNG